LEEAEAPVESPEPPQPDPPPLIRVKCVVVGDREIGKTCLALTYIGESLSAEYIPTVFDDYHTPRMIGGEGIDLLICDTSGQTEYERLRPHSYPFTEVFVICFSLVSPESLQHVREYWLREINQYSPGIPYILVGLQCDRRNVLAEHPDRATSPELVAVPSARGSAMKREIGARSYVECSSLTQINVAQVFERVIRVARARARSAEPPNQSPETATPPSARRAKKLPSFL
jgi:small GTP-binding protein